MAYQTGTATGGVDLLDKLKDFLVANGWTVNRYDTQGAGKRLQVQYSTDVFINMRVFVGEVTSSGGSGSMEANNAFTNGLMMNGSTGYASGQDWYNQAGAYQNTGGVYLITGIEGLNAAIPSYSFFAFNACVYVVVEQTAGRFHWLGFGRLEKTDTYTGGQFFFGKHRPATNASTGTTTPTVSFAGDSWAGVGQSRAFLRLAGVDGFTGWAPSESFGRAGEPRCGDTVQKMQSLWQVAPSRFNSLSVLLPVAMICTRDGSNFQDTTPFSIMGYFSGLNFVNIRNLATGAIYSVASDNYKVFSFHEKVDEVPLSFPNFTTGNLGFALKTN
jgi:hypothetical protein